MKNHVVLALASLRILCSRLEAQVPLVLNHQGRVAVGGVPFNGTGQFKFALVNGGVNTSVQATAVATISGGFLTIVTPGDVGSGYVAPPLVTISGGAGSGAVVTAHVVGGAVTSYTVNSPGGGYLSVPTVTVAAPPPNYSYTTYWSNAVDVSPADGQPDTSVGVSVNKGLYSVGLGDTAVMLALDAEMLAHPDVRLRVWFNDGTTGFQQLATDQRLGSVAYAVMAKTAETATTATSVATPPGMAYIPGGAFTMGRTSGDADEDAVPVDVTVSPFYMDMHEVSWSQWRSVYIWATSHGYSLLAGAGKAANHPVESVGWYDVVKWCNARSEQAGKPPVYYTDAGLTAVYRSGYGYVPVFANWSAKGYRLPTEAEWERAARGGVSGQRFPWGDQISQDLANYFADTRDYSYDLGPNGYHPLANYPMTSPGTTPVGTFAPNLYGLYDMAGNVREWCWDVYGTPYAGGTDPHGPASGSVRVIRGGSYGEGAIDCRSANRGYEYADGGNSAVGFRAVLAP